MGEVVLRFTLIFKNIKHILMFLLFPLISYAQPKWNEKNISDFSNDTLAYIKYSFNKDNKKAEDYFKGKTIGEAMPEFGFKTKYITASGFSGVIDRDIVSLMFVFRARQNERGGSEDYGVGIFLATPVSPQNKAVYLKLTSRELIPFDTEILNLIKNLIIQDIYFTSTRLVETD